MPCAVVTIDLQYEFLDPSGSSAGHFEKAVCIPAILSLLAAGREYGHKIIHVRSILDGGDSLPSRLRGSFPNGYCVRGSPETELVAGIAHDW